MAKVPFSKLKCKINEDIKELKLSDDITIEVKQYLPIQEKLKLISRVVELAHEEDYNYSNPVKANTFAELEIVFAYTNLSFTDKQKEEPAKLYDLLVSSGIIFKICEAIPTEELNIIFTGVRESIESIYKYQNSVLGLLDIIKSEYGDANEEIAKFKEQITDPNALSFVKDMLSTFGQEI